MQFLIADTFTDSLARLTGQEQKAVKTTAFDLQMNPANPGMKFHRLDKARDQHFWSVRVSRDIRLIVHKTGSSLLLCYVDHHDAAYQWAERRRLEAHPKTGAAQLVEIRETIKEITIPQYMDTQQPKDAAAPAISGISDEELLAYGIPEEWLADVRNATEDQILEIADHLPAEAAEAVLSLAVGEKPEVFQPSSVHETPFDHPDAQRRFRVMTNLEELERALDAPWEKWTVFLHPAQQEFVVKDFSGPARVSGSAGTGKTIVALHRAVALAEKNPQARILLTTFSEPLANMLGRKLRLLISNRPRIGERLEVHSMSIIARRLYQLNIGSTSIATKAEIADIIAAEAKNSDHSFALAFIESEWEQVIDAWQLDHWEAYRDILRLGRKSRLLERQRVMLWQIFDRVRSSLAARALMTEADLYSQLAQKLIATGKSPFDFAVVDEAQDISVAQLRFLAALVPTGTNSLFFAGDLGQRIFRQAFSWKSLGVDIRGRSRTLRINYRTSHQIRAQADKLLGPKISDIDGNIEDRRGTVSVFNGPKPEINIFPSPEKEIQYVGQWISGQIKDGIEAQEIGVFVRSAAQLEVARKAIEISGQAYQILDEKFDILNNKIVISTMHLAKGLEFRAVAVVSCNDEVLPLQERIETVADESDLEEVYNTERHLLYVACTRARDQLLVTGVDPASEFLDDMTGR